MYQSTFPLPPHWVHVLGVSTLGWAVVDDPVGRSEQAYAHSLDEMQRLASQWVEKMSMMGMVT
jgi:hypothetical protein